jgi:hypothetical protein
MPLTRAFEEPEISPELRKIYADIRHRLDLPFVPNLFKVVAGVPEYFRAMWLDLSEVAGSKEFHAGARALEEFARSQSIYAGWRIGDQRKALSGQKFSQYDEEVLTGVIAVFGKALPQMALFTRLMQAGCSGGQRGRVSQLKQASALSRWFRLYVPTERDAGIRAWLIYSDIKRTTGCKVIPDVFRTLAPYPGYLASTWVEMKKLLQDAAFRRAVDDVGRRSRALLNGLPVRDHRKLTKNLSPQQWREIEEVAETFARVLPQFLMFTAVWQRSFRSSGLGSAFGAA